MISIEFAQAINLAKAREYAKAFSILTDIVKQDPLNENAWGWLAVCVDDDDLCLYCLKKVLEINPKNGQAMNALLRIEARGVTKPRPIQLEQADSGEIQPRSEIEAEQGKSAVEEKKGTKKLSTELPDLAIENIRQVVADQKMRAQKKKKLRNNPDNERPIKHEKKKRPQRKKNTSVNKQIEIKFRKPEVYVFKPEEDFFYGFKKAGLNLLSRQTTGLFGKTIVIDGMRISAFKRPQCLSADPDDYEQQCDSCEFFLPLNCLLKYDQFLMDDINSLFGNRVDQGHRVHPKVKNARRRELILATIYKELKAHGRPLHYSTIGNIIMSRYPKLSITSESIYRIILNHSELFERVDQGVYQAKPTPI